MIAQALQADNVEAYSIVKVATSLACLLLVSAPQFTPFEMLMLELRLTYAQYPVAVAIYRLYLHPLSRFPGPKLWILTRLTFIQSMLRGHNIKDVGRLHAEYGEIVRIAPNELSFAKAEAWNDIYAHRPGHREFPRNPVWWSRPPGQPSSFISADTADHARMRRVLGNAFSEKALRGQEPIVQKYVRLLIERLREKVQAQPDGAVVNIVDWYRYCTVTYLLLDVATNLTITSCYSLTSSVTSTLTSHLIA